MKVLYIVGMDGTIHANHRAHHFITYLERQGVPVDVLSSTPFYTGRNGASAWARLCSGLRESIASPIEVHTRQTGTEVAIRRLPSRLDAFLQAGWAYLHLSPLWGKRYDVCIFGNPDNVLLPLLMKRRGQIETIIYDDWDFYPGFNRSRLWSQLTAYREHLCVSLAAVVISVGGLLAELRVKQGAVRVLVIPNGVNYGLFATAQTKRPHPPTLIYTGMLAEDWGVDVSIQGFAQVYKQVPEARYLIIGAGEDRYLGHLRRLVDQLGLGECVVFLGRQRYEDLPYYLAEADIGVALHKPNALMRYAVPLKVVEYMAAGVAVVATGLGETEKLIAEAGSGRCVPFSPEAFASAALDILRDSAVRTGFCEKGKTYARRFDWDALFSGLLDVIESAVPASVGLTDHAT